MNNTKIIIAIIIFSLSLLACNQESAPLAQDTRPTVNAKIILVGGSNVDRDYEVSGKVTAKNNARIAARIMGYVTSVNANVGDYIQAGQILAIISDNELQSSKAQAEAGIREAKTALQNIQKDYNRISALYDKGSATQKELDDISTQKDVMLAKIKQAEEGKRQIETTLTYTRIKAPFSGMITEKHIQGGELTSPGKTLFHIESNRTFQVEAMIPESQISAIKKGKEVNVIIKSTRAKIKGTINEFSQSSTNTGGQFLVKVNLNKKDVNNTKLFSGMYVKLRIPKEQNDSSTGIDKKILVDQSAIIHKGQLTGIYTLSSDNQAVLRWIRLGAQYDQQVEVLSGLSIGENYLISTDGRLLNGVKVNVIQ